MRLSHRYWLLLAREPYPNSEIMSRLLTGTLGFIRAISRYTELLRIDGGSSSKTVAVLDWLTVNTNGNKSTTLKAFSSALEALEGMLQVCEPG